MVDICTVYTVKLCLIGIVQFRLHDQACINRSNGTTKYSTKHQSREEGLLIPLLTW